MPEMMVKIGNKTSESFTTNIGTPQGDGILPKLFVLYLKRKADDLKREFGRECIELSYADDQIFVGDQETIQGIEEKMKHIYGKYDLNVNVDKMARGSMRNCNLSILGSLIDEDQEVRNGIRKATGVAKDLHHLITNKKILRKRRIKIYETHIRPVLVYNAETWTNGASTKGAVFERKCLRKCLRLFYKPGERNEL